MAFKPEGTPIKSKQKCEEHNCGLLYWLHDKTTYSHYYCETGDHWLDLRLSAEDEVR